jgi:hypothetical protein
MGRHLPAGLSDAQQRVLSDFFAGHISAGQLTQRLGIASSPPRGSSPDPSAPTQDVDPEIPGDRPARTASRSI